MLAEDNVIHKRTLSLHKLRLMLHERAPHLIHHLFEDHVSVVGSIAFDGSHYEITDSVHCVRQLIQ